jgi:cytidylate kinase
MARPEYFKRTTELIRRLKYTGSVCISGLTASGKTTHAHLLAGELGLTYVSGSQIQLNFMGVSPIQSKDFWITDKAKSFWNKNEFNRIDAELLRLESSADGYIFDTSTMPWRHKRPALCIWLESSLQSRVIKSIVSHRGSQTFSPEDYPQRIAEKDRSTITLYKQLYGIDIGSDLSAFDLILDISSLITEPTLRASLRSIAIAHSIIHPAVGWYLTKDTKFLHKFEEVVQQQSHLIVRNALLGLVGNHRSNKGECHLSERAKHKHRTRHEP